MVGNCKFFQNDDQEMGIISGVKIQITPPVTESSILIDWKSVILYQSLK